MRKFSDRIIKNGDELLFYKNDRNSKDIALVLHGLKVEKYYNSDISNSIKHLIEFLRTRYTAVALFKYNFKRYGKESAINLADAIHSINKNSKIDLYGHTKGGVISLLCMTKYFNNSNRINKLVQICSPNCGTTIELLKYIPKTFRHPYFLYGFF